MSEENNTRATEEEVKSVSLQKLPDLKTIREERGLTIEDIILKTRLSATILDAIENGKFPLLPAPVYAKKFIQIYAEVVGIDPETILAHYQRHVDAIQVAPEEVKVVKAQIVCGRKPFTRYLLYVVLALAIIAVAFIMYVFFHKKEAVGTIQHNVTVDEQKNVPTPAPAVRERPLETAANVPPPAMVSPKETTQNPNTTQLDLRIEATEDTWINITEDRNPPRQILLKAGDTLSRKAREFFIMDVGNAAGVNITFLGKPLGKLGQKGQVVHLRLPQQ